MVYRQEWREATIEKEEKNVYSSTKLSVFTQKYCIAAVEEPDFVKPLNQVSPLCQSLSSQSKDAPHSLFSSPLFFFVSPFLSHRLSCIVQFSHVDCSFLARLSDC
jgi:hypothetical protein